MIIEIGEEAVDEIVRVWLNRKLPWVREQLHNGYVHPEDEKMYHKDIKAMERLLDYLGGDVCS